MNSLRQSRGFRQVTTPPLTASWRFRAVSACLLLTFLGIYLSQFTEMGHVYPVLSFRTRGGDFRIFFDGAVRFSLGDPLGQGFNKPPLLAAFLAPLTVLRYQHALLTFQLLIVATVSLAALAIVRALRQPMGVALILAAAILGSYPFAFLLDRGNIDGIIYFIALCGFLLQGRGRELLGVLCFATAAALNPSILAALPGFAARGELRRTAVTGILAGSLVILLLCLTPHRSLTWLDTIAVRATLTGWASENGSLFRLGEALGCADAATWGLTVVLTLPLAMGLLVAGSRRSLGAADRFLLIFPLCQVYPRVAFLYGYVLFPLLLLRYCRRDCPEGWAARIECASSLVGITGLLLALVPLGYLVNAGVPESRVTWLPSLGLALLLLANSLLVWFTAPAVGENRKGFSSAGEMIAICTVLFICGAALTANVRRALHPAPVAPSLVDQIPLRWPDIHPRPPFGIAEIRQEWGIPHLNTNLLGQPLRVAGTSYQQGIATHAEGRILIILPPHSRRLSGAVGIDEASLGSASGVIFVIRDGSKELFRSPKMYSDTPALSFSVPVEGLATVELLAINARPVNHYNHSNWLDMTID